MLFQCKDAINCLLIGMGQNHKKINVHSTMLISSAFKTHLSSKILAILLRLSTWIVLFRNLSIAEK
jgi:hypothetical protein